MSQVRRPVFDHVAIAVASWRDGYPSLVHRYGGRWYRGGNAGEFSPAQLCYRNEMKIELLEPGTHAGGFVERFLARSGPGAHHLTFYVPDIRAFAEGCRALGLAMTPAFLSLPDRDELFLHPKATGFGTLLQAIEDRMDFGDDQPPPEGFPEHRGPEHEVVWVALQVRDFSLALGVFAGVLEGRVVERHADEGLEWALLEWDPARRLLVFHTERQDLPGREPGGSGVDHVLVARRTLAPIDPSVILATHVPAAPALGLRVMEVDSR